jgi:Mce-associated membrane protein
MIPRVTSDAPPRPRDDDESVSGDQPDRAERTDPLNPADRADTTADESTADESTADESTADESTADESAAESSADDEAPSDEAPSDEAPSDEAPARQARVREKRVREKRVRQTEDDVDADGGGRRRRSAPTLPLVPALTTLLVLLLAGVAFLWFTRPQPSSVSTGYSAVLAQARSQVVDMTSFDYLTLDDDIEQIRRVTTGDLEEESVDQLDSRRQELTDAQVIVNTEVIAAGVTQADADDATVMLVIQSTRESAAAQQPEVAKYRIEVTLVKEDGRWLLSGLTGR